MVRARNLGLKLVNLSARLINTTVWLKAAAFANRKVPRADCPEREGRTMRTCCARCCSPPFHKDADADRPELSGAACIRPATDENSAAIRDTLTRGGTRGERFASAGSKGCSDDHKSKKDCPLFMTGGIAHAIEVRRFGPDELRKRRDCRTIPEGRNQREQRLHRGFLLVLKKPFHAKRMHTKGQPVTSTRLPSLFRMRRIQAYASCLIFSGKMEA